MAKHGGRTTGWVKKGVFLALKKIQRNVRNLLLRNKPMSGESGRAACGGVMTDGRGAQGER